MSTPGVEPGLSRPQRDVLTTRRCGPLCHLSPSPNGALHHGPHARSAKSDRAEETHKRRALKQRVSKHNARIKVSKFSRRSKFLFGLRDFYFYFLARRVQQHIWKTGKTMETFCFCSLPVFSKDLMNSLPVVRIQ